MLMGNQRQVSFVDNTQDVYQDGSQGAFQENYFGFGSEEFVEGQEEVNYLGNQGNFNNAFKPFNNSHPNFSYRSPNVENPKDQTYPNQQQGFQPRPFNNGQARPTQAFNQPRPNFQQQSFQPRGSNFQGNFQPRSSNFQPQAPSTQSPQDIDIKAMFQTIMEGQARGQRESEKRFKEMQLQVDQVTSNVKSLESRVAQIASTSKQPTGIFPGKPETNPKAPCNAILESAVHEHLVEDAKLPSEEEFLTQESENVKKLAVEESSSKDSYAMKKSLEDPKEKFLKIIALVEKEERLEMEELKSRQEASQPRTPPTLKTLYKQDNPGKFNIPVSLGGRLLKDALCDSGSYVNVISWELAKELNLKGMKPHTTPLTFGDASRKVPKGIIERCPIFVGDCIVEADLLVLDMVNSTKQPLLLGTPFLFTTGAVIDYVKREMVLKNVDELVRYFITPPQESSGTIIQDKAFFEPRRFLTTETIFHLDLDELGTEKTLKIEVPSQEEATSRAVENKLGTEFKELRVDYVAKETKGLEKEVPSREEATSRTVETKFDKELKILQNEHVAKATTLKDEVPSREEATSQVVDSTFATEVNVFKIATVSTKMKLENEAPLSKEAASQAVGGTSKKGNEMGTDAKGTKRTKLKKDQNEPHEPHPPSFTLTPSPLSYGKLDCTNAYSNPSFDTRFFLDSTSVSDHDFGTVNATMAIRFGFLLDDPGPLQDGPSSITN